MEKTKIGFMSRNFVLKNAHAAFVLIMLVSLSLGMIPVSAKYTGKRFVVPYHYTQDEDSEGAAPTRVSATT